MPFVKIFRYYNFAGSGFAFIIRRSCSNLIVPKIRNKTMYNMKTVYFHHCEQEDKVQVTINFNELNSKKVIFFERSILENLVNFIQRLDNKLNTICCKRMKKKGVEVESIPAVSSLLLFNNEPISDTIVFRDLFKNSDFEGKLKFKILESDYDVQINCPLIKKMELPELLFVGCTVQPESIKTQFVDFKYSGYTWYKSTHPQSEKKWEKCGEGLSYKIKEEDLDNHLKVVCTPKMNDKVGPKFETISKGPVENCVNFSVILNRHKFTKEKLGSNEFRILTYNILADMYTNTKEAKTHIFTFCAPEYLSTFYREQLLNFELEGYNADIICLQEVEKKFFTKNVGLYNGWGYECIYNGKEGVREGSAILFDRNKFNIISQGQYSFTNELLHNPLLEDVKSKIEGNEKLIERLKALVSQIQVAVLEYITDNILIIGNVHFYFHPDASHIRLLQGIISMRILLKTVEEVKKMKPDKEISILLCGDFNSTPDCGFHKFLNKGSVDDSEPCWKSNESEIIEGISSSHSLKMKSCYNDNILTNYTPSFKACIDYIYFQTDHLELKQTVPLPSEAVLSEFSGIPSRYLPSDHVALIADLKFKD